MKKVKRMNNLKQIRTKKGITRKELAEKSGISARTIESYEQRKRNINKAKIETIIKLSKALECNIEDIM